MFRFFVAILSLLVAFLASFLLGFDTATPPPKDELAKTLDRPTLLQDGYDRRAKEITLRLRNTTCKSATGSGSAFPIDPKIIVTNRHVLDDAARIELNTWDGERIPVDKKKVRIARSIDLAFIYLEKPLETTPGSAPYKRGQRVTAVGYPGGKQLRLLSGRLKGNIAARKLLKKGYRGQILVTSARVQRGNSGGPLLNSQGDIIGVIFAAGIIKGKTVESYAIPIREALDLAGGKSTSKIKSC